MTASLSLEAARIADRVSRDLQHVDPETGRPITNGSTAAEQAKQQPTAPDYTAERIRQQTAKERERAESRAALRAHHAREAGALELFVEAVAELFACPAMNSDAGRSRLRPALAEARQLAKFFGASGEIRRPSVPGRDAAGRFVGTR